MKTNNSSSSSDGGQSGQLTFVMAVNLLMVVVVISVLFNIPALLVLNRAPIRRKVLTPFLMNLCVVSLLVSTLSDGIAMGTQSTRDWATAESDPLCMWLGIINLLSIQCYASTMCAMSSVSYLATLRALRGGVERMTGRAKKLLFTAIWIYCLGLSLSPIGLGLFGPSSSLLTCELQWSSRSRAHVIFNSYVFISVTVVPLLTFVVIQYLLLRTIRNAQATVENSISQRLLNRQKSNSLVIALSMVSHVSMLPQSLANFSVLCMGRNVLTHTTGFILEMLAKFQVVLPPIVYVVLNRSYRAKLVQILSGAQQVQNVNSTERQRRNTLSRQQGQSNHRRVLGGNRVSPMAGTGVSSR